MSEPAEVKYTKRMLELVEQEIAENDRLFMHLDGKLWELQERKKVLCDERRNLYKELRKAESECVCEQPNVPIKIFADGEELKL